MSRELLHFKVSAYTGVHSTCMRTIELIMSQEIRSEKGLNSVMLVGDLKFTF